jgi:transposase
MARPSGKASDLPLHRDLELVFAKLKTLLRKAVERSVDAPRQRVGTTLKTFSKTECTNYFSNWDTLLLKLIVL